MATLSALACVVITAVAPAANGSPVVLGFERFHTQKPKADALGGRLLMAELRCASCHSGIEALRLPPAADLSDVGSRLDQDALLRWLRTPQKLKPGTTMPALFKDTPEDRVDAEYIAAYLATLKNPNRTEPLASDAANGRRLYTELGCVACHAAEPFSTSTSSPAQPTSADERQVPLVLARHYKREALVQFLLDPLKTRPAGRMPSFHLSAQEAADLSAYLQSAPLPTNSGTAAGASPSKANAATAAHVDAGRAAFARRGCAACHTTDTSPPPQPTATPLAGLRADRGCLAETPDAGVPDFALNALQRESIRSALVQALPNAPKSASAQTDFAMEQLNCLACHVRAGRGGPPASSLAYFTANDPGAESLGELGHLPPKLDGAGAKLTEAWLQKLLWKGGGGVRPYLNTRMPQFGEANAGPLIASLREADRNAAPAEIDTSGVKGHQRGPIGRQLIGTKGLGCVSCHGMLERKSIGPTAPRLTHTTERLEPEYFKRLLLDPQQTQPGTVMPPLLAGRKGAAKDIESLWTYLREAASLPLPEGLLDEGDYELKPQTQKRPIVFRSFIEGAGTHAIALGFPEGVHISFDAARCVWSVAWKGRFLDALNNWKERSMPPIAPLGTELKTLLPIGEQAGTTPSSARFLGYTLDAGGVPTMHYQVGKARVQDRVEPFADGGGFNRRVSVTGSGDGAAAFSLQLPSIVSGNLWVGPGGAQEVLAW